MYTNIPILLARSSPIRKKKEKKKDILDTFVISTFLIFSRRSFSDLQIDETMN